MRKVQANAVLSLDLPGWGGWAGGTSAACDVSECRGAITHPRAQPSGEGSRPRCAQGGTYSRWSLTGERKLPWKPKKKKKSLFPFANEKMEPS